MNDPQDPDPTGMLTMMVTLHELLTSAMEAGFTRKEAFQMVLTAMRPGVEGAHGGQ